MTHRKTVAGPGTGWFPGQETAKLIAHAAIVKGQLVSINAGVTDTGADVFNTTKQPVTGDVTFGMFAIALEDVASGEAGQFALRGRVQALGDSSSGWSLGDTLVSANTTDTLVDAATSGFKILGYALEDAAAGALGWIVFDGIAGFGNAA